MKDFEFDYSVLISDDELEDRNQKEKDFIVDGKRYFGKTARAVDFIDGYDYPVCPSIYALKMGTCAYFSREIEYFAKQFGVEYEHRNEVKVCYDGYGQNKGDDRLRPMLHHYTVLTIDGVECKIDIAGAIMARDYVKNKGANLNASDFVLTEDVEGDPFNCLINNSQEVNSKE